MNLLIVDDDKFLIQKIVTGIDWDEIGIKRVFTADNSVQARKIFETFPVDILVTDIEMPQGSGLELLGWVKSGNYPVESLILSGYVHFSYAQKVIQYGGREYLLKPVSNRELAGAIREIVQEKKSRNPLPGEKAEHFAAWERAFREPKLRIPGEVSADCGETDRFRIEILRNLSEVGQNDTDRKVLDFVVKNMVQEFFEGRGLELEYAGRAGEDVWLVLFRENARFVSIEEYTSQMQECLLDVVRLDFCVYLGRDCTLKELPDDCERLWRICREAVPDERKFIREDLWEEREETHALPDFRALSRTMREDVPAAEKELLDRVGALTQNGGFQGRLSGTDGPDAADDRPVPVRAQHSSLAYF